MHTSAWKQLTERMWKYNKTPLPSSGQYLELLITHGFVLVVTFNGCCILFGSNRYELFYGAINKNM